MKRLAVSALWFYSCWAFGSMLAFVAGVPDLLGPFLGVSAGAFVWLDPRHLIWNRSAQGTPAATGSAAAAA